MEEEVAALISNTKNISLKDELEDYLGIIDDFLLMYDEDGSEEAVDQLAVIAKYKNGAVSIVEETKQIQIDDSWRKLVPSILKQK
jgi:NTP pyrophosphatase (non-canonical NTP hydrolase)